MFQHVSTANVPLNLSVELLNLRYYYHVDPALEGGDMELCGREPFDILAMADAGDNSFEFDHRRLKEALSGEKQRLPHCRVSIQAGGLGMTGDDWGGPHAFQHSNHHGAGRRSHEANKDLTQKILC